MNIYVISGSTSGHVNVSADDTAMGDDAQQFYPNRITYGFTTVKLGADGGINLKNYANTPIDVLVDVEGWYADPLAPVISCPQPYSVGSWTATFPTDGITCTFSAPPASNDSTLFEVDDNNVAVWAASPDASGATTGSFTFTPFGGLNTMLVTMRDDSDNILSQTQFSFGVGDWAQASLTQTPASGLTLNTTPTLSVAPDGDAFQGDTQAQFTISTNADGLSSPVAQSDWGEFSWDVPDGVLQNGQTYYWSAEVKGASGTRQSLSDMHTGAVSFMTSDQDTETTVESTTVASDGGTGVSDDGDEFSAKAKSARPAGDDVNTSWLDKYGYRVVLRTRYKLKESATHGVGVNVLKAVTKTFDSRKLDNPTTYVYWTTVNKYSRGRVVATVHFKTLVAKKPNRYDGRDTGLISGYCNHYQGFCPSWVNQLVG